MKFTVTASVASFASIVAAAVQVGVPFGLITIRSGSSVQNAGLSIDGDNVVIGPDLPEFTGVFEADNSVRVNGGPSFLGLNDAGDLVLSPTGTPFDVEDSRFTFKGSADFFASPKNPGPGFTITTKNKTANDLGVALRAFFSEAPVNSTVAPTTTAPPTTAPPTTSSSSKSTSAGPVNTTISTTVTSCPGGCSTVAPTTKIPQVNGAIQTAVGLGAIVAGAAGALLL